jgi:hypothetical protein
VVAEVVSRVSALWGAALALIGFVITQGVLKFVIEPIQEQRRLIGEVAHELSMHYYIQDVQEDGVEEVRKTLRSLAARLWSSLWAIPFYNAFARLGVVPKVEDVVAAATELKAWARHLGSPATPAPGDAITRNIVAVSERLGIRVRLTRH